jgi:hypothetical protein
MYKYTEGVHLAHCFQGEYKTTCKYGDDNCPAQPDPAAEAQKLYDQVERILVPFVNHWHRPDAARAVLDFIRSKVSND